MHPDLQSFLEKEVPKGKKKVSVTLGVGDAKIAASISDGLGISCQHSGIVVELNRGNLLSSQVYSEGCISAFHDYLRMLL